MLLSKVFYSSIACDATFINCTNDIRLTSSPFEKSDIYLTRDRNF